MPLEHTTFTLSLVWSQQAIVVAQYTVWGTQQKIILNKKRHHGSDVRKCLEMETFVVIEVHQLSVIDSWQLSKMLQNCSKNSVCSFSIQFVVVAFLLWRIFLCSVVITGSLPPVNITFELANAHITVKLYCTFLSVHSVYSAGHRSCVFFPAVVCLRHADTDWSCHFCFIIDTEVTLSANVFKCIYLCVFILTLLVIPSSD